MGAKHAGDLCPKCGKSMDAAPGTMYWRGRFFAGIVCWPCKVLYDNADDSFMEHVNASSVHAK